MKKILGVILLVFFAAASCNRQAQNTPAEQTQQPKEIPIANAKARITKKFFGTKVSPQNSPVQPERFSGYHTGVDFETYPEEKGVAVPIFAICDGKILQSRTASGYGGVIVQSCNIDNQDVTVIYGHINISSAVKAGVTAKTGDQLAILGEQGVQTDGERKHLHLGIHKGTAINIKGYVQTQAELSGWLDYQTIMP